MTSYPVVLREFVAADAPRLCELCGDIEVAQMTATIPHPYPISAALSFLGRVAAERASGTAWTYAVERVDDRELVGCAALADDQEPRGNLGYWIGRAYWGSGYATASARALLAVGFSQLEHDALTAMHLARNAASGRVLEKCGMVAGPVVERPHRDGGIEPFRTWAITRERWASWSEAPCARR